MESGKDSSFKKFESPCSQCKKGASLEKGVHLKGMGRAKAKPVFSFEDLYNLYEKFEKDRVKKAEAQTGQKGIKPDPFANFVATKTELCPHSLISLNSTYWLETLALLDGEMGVQLPGQIDEIPGLFFDALSIVRVSRQLAKKEDKS